MTDTATDTAAETAPAVRQPTKVYARPYDIYDGHPTKNMAVLDAFAAKPEFLAYPVEPDAARQLMAIVLMNPDNVCYEVWKGRDFVGVVFLTRIIPHVDALLHFLFLDNLVGKRTLLKNFVRCCFEEWGLNRLSIEVPDGSKVERFARSVLGFRYEGEGQLNVASARLASRAQGAAYDGQGYRDVIRLRLLADEWAASHVVS